LTKNMFDHRHASYNESLGLAAFALFMADTPEVAFDSYAHRCLREGRINHFLEKFPRGNSKSTSYWDKTALTRDQQLRQPTTSV
jgi:hypothetical protein